MTDSSQWPLACIALGSNLGQSRRLLLAAWQALGEHPDIILQQLSPPYRTKPVEMNSGHWFINAAGLLRSSLTSEALLDVLLEIEQRFGRIRSPEQQGYQDRTLDLDLLLIDKLVLHTERLILPHPKLDKRLFVLAPLADIAPELQHPLLGKSIVELLTKLEPQLDPGCLEHPGCLEQVLWEEE